MENLNKKSILVIEDHPPLRKTLEELIGTEYPVRSAKAPSKALELIHEQTPDLIICDVMLPEQDGFQFIKVLKTNPKYEAIPVIFLTALTDDNNLQTGFDSGGLDYITKPFKSADLMARIKAILRHTKRLREFFERKSILKKSEGDNLNSLENKFTDMILQYIDANFDNPALSLADIAKHMNMSVSTLKRWSRKTNGTTVAVLLKKYRLNRSEIMVRQGLGSIAEISARCGFATQQYFSRCFKEEFGMPPHHYQVAKRNV